MLPGVQNPELCEGDGVGGQGVLDGLLARARDLAPVALHAFAPNLLLTLLLALAVAALLSSSVQLRTWRLWLWLSAVMLPLPYTWTAARDSGTPGCHWGQPPWDFAPQAANPEITYNILLMVPAGAAAWLWPDGPRRLAALGCALASPTVIEFGQYVLPQLHRSCQAGDIINNVIGALLGWSLVAGGWAGVRIWRGAP